MLPAMTPDPIDQLSRALDVCGALISGVGSGQWDGPTPCTELTVRDLVVHVVTGNYVFAEVLAGTPLVAARAGAQVTPDGDLAAQYRDSARKLTAAYREPGVMEREFVISPGAMPGLGTLHIRIVELLVHGWDLAQATGQAADFPEDIAEQEIDRTQAALEAGPADRRPFDPPQPAAADAPAIDRLAALLGRKVTA
jgi:uncharacterized protein (TIGR03086 family)